MKITNLNQKVTKKIYEVAVQDVCDGIIGYFTTKEEAFKIAKQAKPEYGNHPVHVHEMYWYELEEEYTFDYNADFTVMIF